MSLLSDIVYATVALVTSPVWGFRLWRTGKWRTDWAGRFGQCDLPGDARPTLLIHAVSVGEVNAIRQLVDQLDARFADMVRIVISTTTDTGTARAESLFEPQHRVVRYPLDFTWSVQRFLYRVNPAAVVLVELEVWPTFVAECEAMGTPVVVVNGRLSERSFGRYKLIKALVGGAFRRLAAAGVQDPAYAERFVAMGVPRERVSVTGTMKWDTAVIADDVSGAEELATALGIDRDKPLVVCGSTGPGEEQMLVERLGDLSVETIDGDTPVQLLIAPRKPERFDEAAAALAVAGKVVRRTDHADGTSRTPNDTRLFLLDTIGDLRKAYALADVAIVGRSFCPLYGSDMIEPIALGKPTVIGPNVADFRDTMRRFLADDGIVQLDGPDTLRDTVAGLLNDPDKARAIAERGRDVIRQQQGATARHVDLIAAVLDGRRNTRL